MPAAPLQQLEERLVEQWDLIYKNTIRHLILRDAAEAGRVYSKTGQAHQVLKKMRLCINELHFKMDLFHTSILNDYSFRTDIHDLQGNVFLCTAVCTFYTLDLFPVPNGVGSLRVKDIKANSATVTWFEPDGNLDFYTITITPVTGGTGGKATPPKVAKGGTRTSLLSGLTTGKPYTVSVRTLVGTGTMTRHGPAAATTFAPGK
jgi:hypothetical protein